MIRDRRFEMISIEVNRKQITALTQVLCEPSVCHTAHRLDIRKHKPKGSIFVYELNRTGKAERVHVVKPNGEVNVTD
jgi:hypothetical protein